MAKKLFKISGYFSWVKTIVLETESCWMFLLIIFRNKLHEWSRISWGLEYLEEVVEKVSPFMSFTGHSDE